MKKMIVFGVLGLLQVVGAVFGTLYFTGTLSDGNEVQAEEIAEKPKSKDAIYFELSPEFIVNFEGKSRPRYLQIDLVAVSYEQEAVDALQLHMPVIRNELLLLFGTQKSTDLESRDGKEVLRTDALSVIQGVMTEHYGSEGVENIYFTRLVMQ